jgi:hypothetical protein
MSSTGSVGKVTITFANGEIVSNSPSGYDATQEQRVTVHGTIKRLHPCETHREHATGDTVFNNDGSPRANPNGYHHGCPHCAQMTTYEQLEGVD